MPLLSLARAATAPLGPSSSNASPSADTVHPQLMAPCSCAASRCSTPQLPGGCPQHTASCGVQDQGILDLEAPATTSSAPLSTVIATPTHQAGVSMLVAQPAELAVMHDGAVKTCSLCGNTKALQDFGPKKGARDGKDCYCRVCSTLRRRYSIPVRPAPPRIPLL